REHRRRAGRGAGRPARRRRDARSPARRVRPAGQPRPPCAVAVLLRRAEPAPDRRSDARLRVAHLADPHARAQAPARPGRVRPGRGGMKRSTWIAVLLTALVLIAAGNLPRMQWEPFAGSLGTMLTRTSRDVLPRAFAARLPHTSNVTSAHARTAAAQPLARFTPPSLLV